MWKRRCLTFDTLLTLAAQRVSKTLMLHAKNVISNDKKCFDWQKNVIKNCLAYRWMIRSSAQYHHDQVDQVSQSIVINVYVDCMWKSLTSNRWHHHCNRKEKKILIKNFVTKKDWNQLIKFKVKFCRQKLFSISKNRVSWYWKHQIS